MSTQRHELKFGLKLHRQGELRQAAEVYQAMLRQNPRQADALHLLGVVALQQGDRPRAIELICQAVALNPSVTAYHCNLGEAYRQSGQAQRSAGCFQTALAIDPDCADAHNGLGLMLMAQGRTAEAIDRYQAALAAKPEFPLAHVNLGNALVQQGKNDDALGHFRRAIELAPQLALAHCNLGQLLLEERHVGEAQHHCREAVRLQPNLAEAHNNLGNVFRTLGQITEAKACYAEALRLNPDLAMVYNNLGQALQEEGRVDASLPWYQQALKREPTSARFHANFASALEELDRHDEAVAHFQDAIRLGPSHVEAHHGLGLLRHGQGRFEEACACFREALRLRPHFAEAHFSLGNIAQELGELQEAEQFFREAIRCDSRNAAAHAALATLLRKRLPAADLAALKNLLADPHLNDNRRCALHLGLAHVLDDQDEYLQAAEHVVQGKALDAAIRKNRGRAYNPEAHARFVDQVLATFTSDFFARIAGWGLETETPIFIFGLPRSGTTLVEQVLASHSQVHGAGELGLARKVFEKLPEDATRRKGAALEQAAFAALTRLDCDGLRRLGEDHLAQLRALSSAARITDKMPDNYLFLGLLVALFPRARFIHCRRDLRDIAVSCWMTHFRQINWASELEHIAARFREYRRVMAHWQQVMPVPVLDIDYEEMVADLENVAVRLVTWCGLRWEPACLAFHETARPIRTASVAQVRRPIYTRSLQRWKNYSDSLGQLFTQLNCGTDD